MLDILTEKRTDGQMGGRGGEADREGGSDPSKAGLPASCMMNVV